MSGCECKPERAQPSSNRAAANASPKGRSHQAIERLRMQARKGAAIKQSSGCECKREKAQPSSNRAAANASPKGRSHQAIERLRMNASNLSPSGRNINECTLAAAQPSTRREK